MASAITEQRVVVVGAGMGGLAAALRLSAAGRQVTVVEAAAAPGGKMRHVSAGGRTFDAGPTVLTMKWAFDSLLEACGTTLDREIPMETAGVIARHYWDGGACLDLHADVADSVRAIRDFAGQRDADGYQAFARDSRRVFELLKDTFIDATRPNPITLSRRVGLSKPGALFALKPFSSLWSVLGDYFSDERLRQLFGRYATYCGSSPYLAPATLMLVAHVEQEGVWIPEGGMHAVARKFADLAVGLGAEFRYGAKVAEIVSNPDGRSVSGVKLEIGEFIPAGQVVFNGDAAALPRLLGRSNAKKRAGAKTARSQSALVLCGLAEPDGVPLAHHTVFFSENYRAEFDAVFDRGEAPRDPTVYVCAQDRTADGHRKGSATSDPVERIYCLTNLPPDGDRHDYTEQELNQCLTAMDRRMAANGLVLRRDRAAQVVTAPDTFEQLFPATGGGLYGQPSHGWMASFQRQGARSPLRGLYLAGGSVHPGPGVPMALLSGKIAAETLLTDHPSTGRSHPVVIAGGISTRPATAGATPSR